MSSSMPPLWRQITQVHRLVGGKCKKCGTVNFPVKKICTNCGGTEFEEHRIARRGKVLTYVVAHRMPPGVQAPIALAIIETEDGARMTGWSTDCDPYDVKVDMPVELVFRMVGPPRGGAVSYGFKFRPLMNS